MLKKILDFFAGKRELEEIRLSKAEMKSKAQQMIDEYIEKSIKPSFENIIDEIKQLEKDVEEKCITLEESKLKNEKIPFKEKQYMEGNRKSYVKHARILLKNISLPDTFNLIEEKMPHLAELIENFGKQTMRSRQILHHFFEHETEAIHDTIAKINKQFEYLKKLTEDEKYKKHLNALDAVNKYENAVNARKSLTQEIKSNEELIKKSKQDFEKYNQLLNQKKQSKEYNRLNELKKELTEKQNKINTISADVNKIFAKFERALKKYERIAIDDSAWLHAYMKNAFQALSADSEGKGNNILKGLKEKINQNSIDLKNSDKIIASIDEILQEEQLQSLHKEIIMLTKSIDSIKKEIRSISIADEIEELEKLTASNQRIFNDHENQAEELKKKLQEMKLDKYLKNVEDAFSDSMQAKVILE